MNTDKVAKELLDLPPDRQREIAGVLLVAADDKDKARRAGAVVADRLRAKMGRTNPGSFDEKGGFGGKNTADSAGARCRMPTSRGRRTS